MGRKSRRVLVTLLIASAAFSASATILRNEMTGFVFRDGQAFPQRFGRPDESKSAYHIRWSEHLRVGKDALISEPSVRAESPIAWIESEPIPVDINWRPPRQVNLKLRLKGSVRRGDFLPRVFVRYGCDRVHWSRWQMMKAAKPEASETTGAVQPFRLRYELDVVASDEARENYVQLMDAWRQTDPDWECDEEELCRWLAREYPEFFSTQFPFVGYYQYLIEDPCWVDVRLEGIDLETFWGVGGTHSMPKRGVRPADGPWRFTWESGANDTPSQADRKRRGASDTKKVPATPVE